MALVVGQFLGYWTALADPYSLTKYLLLSASVVIGIWGGFKRTKIDTSLMLYVLVLALCTAMSRDWEMSLLGQYGAYFDGLIPTLAVAGAFYCGTSLVPDDVIDYVVWAAALASVYGIVQWFGFLQPYPLASGRVYATVGSAPYLSGMLGFAMFFSVIRRSWLSIPIGVCLLLTLSRGGIVCVGSGLCLYAVYTMRRRAVLPVLVLCAASLLLAHGIRNFRPHVKSDLGRFHMARVAIEAFKDRPFFGHGPDTFHLIMQEYRDSWLNHDLTSQWSNGYAHNHILDALCTTGGIGASALGVLCVCVAMALIRAGRVDVLCALAGLSVYGCFQSISLPTKAIAAYLVGACLGDGRTVTAWVPRLAPVVVCIQVCILSAGAKLHLLAGKHNNNSIFMDSARYCPNIYR